MLFIIKTYVFTQLICYSHAMHKMSFNKAEHFLNGNFYDDMRIDIQRCHNQIDKVSVKKNKKRRFLFIINITNLLTFLASYVLRLNELFVIVGIKNKWFTTFKNYWEEILNGRPLWSRIEFFSLLHEYRKKQQHTQSLNWGSETQHIKNWQHESEIYSTLHYVIKTTLNPAIKPLLRRGVLPRHARVLEYGCAVAPFYHSYRQFFRFKQCSWILADIPNFPFHYAKYLYIEDPEVDFVTINSNFKSTLQGQAQFDTIILTTVLEHVDNPVQLIDYLLDKLNVGGFLIFDYIKSIGTGLDHPKALALRSEALQIILRRTKIIEGSIDDIDKNIGLCFAKKIA